MANEKEHKVASTCPFCFTDVAGNHEEKCIANQTALLENWDGWKTIKFLHVQCPYYTMVCIHAGFITDKEARAENTINPFNYCALGYPNPLACPWLKLMFVPEHQTLKTIIKENNSTE